MTAPTQTSELAGRATSSSTPAPANSEYQRYDTYQARTGDVILFDGVEMVVWKVDEPGYFGKGVQGKGFKGGPLVWARHERSGLGTVFDASMHETHTITTPPTTTEGSTR